MQLQAIFRKILHFLTDLLNWDIFDRSDRMLSKFFWNSEAIKRSQNQELSDESQGSSNVIWSQRNVIPLPLKALA